MAFSDAFLIRQWIFFFRRTQAITSCEHPIGVDFCMHDRFCPTTWAAMLRLWGGTMDETLFSVHHHNQTNEDNQLKMIDIRLQYVYNVPNFFETFKNSNQKDTVI